MSTWMPPAILLVLALIGSGLLVASLMSIAQVARAARWPTAPGTILDAALVEAESDGTPIYSVRARYRYEVGGVVREGSHLAYGYGPSSNERRHRQILDTLRSSDRVGVRYDPADPSTSSILADDSRLFWLLMAVALGWLAATAALFALWRRGPAP